MGDSNRVPTGITGLDDIINGGLIPGWYYLIRGGPGSGKTIFGLHYLLEGAARGQKVLFITFIESASKIKQCASAFGFDVGNIKFLDLSPDSTFVKEDGDYNLLRSDQLEQKPLIDRITKEISDFRPDRIFFDGITNLKYLISDNFKFRKQILSLMKFTEKFNSTILLASETSSNNLDDDLQYLVDGIFNIEMENDYSVHSINISKFRGSDFKKGNHKFRITSSGIKVISNIRTKEVPLIYSDEIISSGVEEIDKMLSGGIEVGTVTIISGPTGTGKTTLGLQFLSSAVNCGKNAALYVFEEHRQAIIERSAGVNIHLKDLIAENSLIVEEINPTELYPEEFQDRVKQDIEDYNLDLVMIDSINGFSLLYGHLSESIMNKDLYNLVDFLKKHGITVFMINEIKNITGDFQVADNRASSFNDNIIFLRHIETQGKINKVIGILKKRFSDYENQLRRFEITSSGIEVGEPLVNLRGVLTGNPEMLEE